MMAVSYSSIAALTCSMAICFTVAFIGARVTTPEIPTWYASLAKPSWTPPRIAFPVVWPILYFLMALAAWMLWEAPSSPYRNAALVAFAVQLSLNAVWSPIFFGRHDVRSGMIVISALVVAIGITILIALQVDRTAAVLLVPYFAWILFATALNARILALN
jgi:tryptophan-rich sensory protein